MLLSDIFSIPFLICLAICILLIGCSSIYFYQRILQQDHKISSMVSLISSLTEEESKSNTVCGVSTGGNITIDIKPDITPTIINRIQVSDDETDSETESESEDDSEYSTTSSENENDCEILSEIEELNDILELEQNEECKIDLEEESQVVVDEEEAIPYDIDTIKSIHLEQPTDFSIFKTINVIGEVVVSETDDATNYKKMSLSKLREIAQSQGHEDTSKLKKQELLKLLGAE
jgi:hypothetical protein